MRLRDSAAPLIGSRFVRNVAMVGGGIAAGQAISLAFTPFLTRLYGPEAFGAAATFAAIVNIITPLATLGYANAIVMPEDEEDAGAAARLSILCGLIMAPVALLLVHFGKPWLAVWTGLQRATWVLYLIPLSLVVSAFLSVANQAAIRQGLYGAKARAYVGSTLMTNLGKLAGGLLAPSGLLLILLTLMGSALNVVMQLLGVRRQGVLMVRNWFGRRGTRKAARAHRDFALYRMPQSVIRTASIGLPVIVLTAFFGSDSAGQYSITTLILGAPVVLLGDAVGEVFYPKITRAITSHASNAGELILKAMIALLAFGIVPFGTIMLFGNKILPALLGSEWGRAGEFSQWISAWMLAMLVSRPAVVAMPALRMQAALLGYEVIVTVVRFMAIYLGAWFDSDHLGIVAFSLVNVFGYIILAIFVIYKEKDCRKKSI